MATMNQAPTFLIGRGKVFTDINSGSVDSGNSVLVQNNGKIIVAGESYNPVIGASSTDFALACYNPDGTLDTTFGTGGKVLTDIGGASDIAHGATLQQDGKIIVVGESTNTVTSLTAFSLARYNNNGSLDITFGTAGKVITHISGGYAAGYSVTIQPLDGKIIVAGFNPFHGFEVIRYNSNGSLDTTFGVGGMASANLMAIDVARSVTLQNDGRIVVAGWCHTDPALWHFALARFNTDGTLDANFGTGGTVIPDFGVTRSAAGYSVVVQSIDGKIIVAGDSRLNTTPSDGDMTLARFNVDGTLDTGFGTGGVVITDLGGQDYANSVVLQTDGKILVSGWSQNTVSYFRDYALARYNSDGSLDATFGIGGKVLTHLGNGREDLGLSLALLSDGRILVSGYTTTATGWDFSLACYTTDGSLDTTFGGSNSLDATSVCADNGAPVVLDSNVEIYDHELAVGGNYAGAVLTLARHGGASTADHYALLSGGTNPLTEGSDVTINGGIVGVVTTNSGGTLQITFNANATQSIVNTVVQHIAYSHSSGLVATPSSVQIDWTFSDGNDGSQGVGGALSVTGSSNVQVLDLSPPLVTTVSPVVGTNGVAVGSNINLTFNEAIKLGTGSIVIHSGSAAGPVVESYDAATSANLSISGNTLTINPTSNLEGEKHYYITFGVGSVNDLSDNAFAGSTIDFTTQDITPPLVTTVSPVAGASGVAVGSNIVLTFSEDIKLGTGGVVIHSGSAAGPVVESYDAATSTNLSISGNTLIINPTVDLTHSTHYYTALDSGSVNDLSDNPFAGTTTDFTTADPYVPPTGPNITTGIIVGGGVVGLSLWLFVL